MPSSCREEVKLWYKNIVDYHMSVTQKWCKSTYAEYSKSMYLSVIDERTSEMLKSSCKTNI